MIQSAYDMKSLWSNTHAANYLALLPTLIINKVAKEALKFHHTTPNTTV